MKLEVTVLARSEQHRHRQAQATLRPLFEAGMPDVPIECLQQGSVLVRSCRFSEDLHCGY